MKPLVAIVDDEETITSTWADFFADDYDIMTSNDPEGFIDAVTRAERQPDVIVTDLMMPGIRGQDMIDRLKSAGVQSRFIIVSAYAQKSDAVAAINAGVMGLVEKPVKPQVLKEQINTALHSMNEEGPNPDLFEMCALLNQRCASLAERLWETENLCTESGVRLFRDKEGLRRYNEYQREEKRILDDIIRLQKKLEQKRL